MKTQPPSLPPAPIYSTECVDSKRAVIKDASGKVIATIARPVSMRAIRDAIAAAQS